MEENTFGTETKRINSSDWDSSFCSNSMFPEDSKLLEWEKIYAMKNYYESKVSD